MSRNAVQKTNPAPTAPVAAAARASLVAKFAARFGVDADKMTGALKATAFKTGKNDPEVTNEQMMALLVVADQYNLNPWTKEIYAFPSDKGIIPIIGVDGWIRIINEHPQLQSIEFIYPPEDTDPEDYYVECVIRRKDRDEPIRVREYLSECRRNTGPWNSHPRRMNRHKALIQAGRVAFGFAGVHDPDEAERIRDAMAIEGEAQEVGRKPATTAPQARAATATQLTHVPVDELRATIDRIGLAENEFLAHFEINSIEELPLNQVANAREYLDGIARG